MTVTNKRVVVKGKKFKNIGNNMVLMPKPVILLTMFAIKMQKLEKVNKMMKDVTYILSMLESKSNTNVVLTKLYFINQVEIHF